jgi:HEAT repeats
MLVLEQGMSTESAAIEVGIFLTHFINTIGDLLLPRHRAVEHENYEQALYLKRFKTQKHKLEIERETLLRKFEFEKEAFKREIAFQAEVERKKLQSEAEIKNYRDFLNAIDELKDQLIEFYPNMPKPEVLVIHHHAKELLNGMWNSENPEESLTYRKRFVQFLTVVSEDVNLAVLQREQNRFLTLPEKVLQYVRGNEHESDSTEKFTEETDDSLKVKISKLLDALSASDVQVRSKAALELGKLGIEEAVPALSYALATDQDPEVRRSAAKALGMLGSKETEI